MTKKTFFFATQQPRKAATITNEEKSRSKVEGNEFGVDLTEARE